MKKPVENSNGQYLLRVYLSPITKGLVTGQDDAVLEVSPDDKLKEEAVSQLRSYAGKHEKIGIARLSPEVTFESSPLPNSSA